MIEKEGFEKDELYFFNRWGGGKAKGEKMNIDTIFLRKRNQSFDIANLLKNSSWQLALTINADTIYMVKNGFMDWCKTNRCKTFYSEYEALTDNYYYKGSKNLPKGMIRRFIGLKFGEEKSAVRANMICEYQRTFEGPNKEPDTLHTNGTSQMNNHIMKLNIDKMPAISGNFKMSDIDLFQMKLIRLK